jgi:hypothetical protein
MFLSFAHAYITPSTFYVQRFHFCEYAVLRYLSVQCVIQNYTFMFFNRLKTKINLHYA